MPHLSVIVVGLDVGCSRLYQNTRALAPCCSREVMEAIIWAGAVHVAVGALAAGQDLDETLPDDIFKICSKSDTYVAVMRKP